jgi:hypothetical protein
MQNSPSLGLGVNEIFRDTREYCFYAITKYDMKLTMIIIRLGNRDYSDKPHLLTSESAAYIYKRVRYRGNKI